MVLTDRQRADLHAGIHEYLLAQPGEAFSAAAKAMYNADPEACSRNFQTAASTGTTSIGSGIRERSAEERGSSTNPGNTSTSTVPTDNTLTNISTTIPLLEKKWTAVPRLQKKVLELEKCLAAGGNAGGRLLLATSSIGSSNTLAEGRRNLPRPPSLRTMIGHTGPITCVQCHPMYALLVSASEDGTLKLWDSDSGELLTTLKGHVDTVTHVSFDSNTATTTTPSSSLGGRFLASASNDWTVKIWRWKDGSTNLSDWTCIQTLRGHDHTVSSVTFVPLSSQSATDTPPIMPTHVISASRDTNLRLWEIATGFCIQTYHHGDWVRCISSTTISTDTYFTTSSKSGIILASAGNDATIKLWTVEYSNSDDDLQRSSKSKHHPPPQLLHRQQQQSIAELRGHTHVIECLSFIFSTQTSSLRSKKNTNKLGHDISTLLVSGSRDKTVKVWNFVLQECLFTFSYHDNWVKCVILHPSGNYVISTGDDRSIRVMDLKVRIMVIKKWVEISSICTYFVNVFSSQKISFCTNSCILSLLRNCFPTPVKANRCLRTIENAHTHFITSIDMHPTLPLLISGSVDQTIRCWALD